MARTKPRLPALGIHLVAVKVVKVSFALSRSAVCRVDSIQALTLTRAFQRVQELRFGVCYEKVKLNLVCKHVAYLGDSHELRSKT
jgi:hypothetical protein